MSLETPNRLAAALRLDLDVLPPDPTFTVSSQVNITEIQVPPGPGTSLEDGFNLILGNKVSRAGGHFIFFQGLDFPPPAAQFGPLPAGESADPFFEVEDGDWTTNGVISPSANVDGIALIGLSLFEFPLLD